MASGRGDLLEPALLRESALENHMVYGFYGVSVFIEGAAWQEIAGGKLRRAEWIDVKPWPPLHRQSLVGDALL